MDKPKEGRVHLGLEFARLSKTELAPSMEEGITIEHLVYAQKYNRALVLEGHGAADMFEQDGKYNVILCTAGYQAIGAEAARIYSKTAGELTHEELVFINYPGTLSDFLKETGYREDTPVSYAILNPKKHVILLYDEDGYMTVTHENEAYHLSIQ